MSIVTLLTLPNKNRSEGSAVFAHTIRPVRQFFKKPVLFTASAFSDPANAFLVLSQPPSILCIISYLLNLSCSMQQLLFFHRKRLYKIEQISAKEHYDHP